MTTYPRTDPATGKPWPAYMGKKEFAQRVLSRSPSYVTQLGDSGRLVLHPNGKWVDVQASLDRIEATASPDKQPVADRHAASRGQALASQPQPEDDDEDDHHQQPEGDKPTGPLYDFQGSKAKREHYAAERERANYLKEAGELMQRGDVVAAFADAGAAIRAAVDAWAADLPPMLAGQGEDAIRTIITDEAERLLADLAARFHKLAGPTA